MAAPCSSYSSLLIHEAAKVLREARVDAPFQTAYFLSGVETIRISEPGGARVVSSDLRRSAMPSYMVVPPDRITRIQRKSVEITIVSQQ